MPYLSQQQKEELTKQENQIKNQLAQKDYGAMYEALLEEISKRELSLCRSKIQNMVAMF